MRIMRTCQPFVLLLVLLALSIAFGDHALAQADSCDPVLTTLANGIYYDTCQQVDSGYACYASRELIAELNAANVAFDEPNKSVEILNLRSLDTQGPAGSAIMYMDTSEGPVKIIVFGDSSVQPTGGEVFTMRKTGGRLLCERTPSGMLVQTRSGESGRVVVNGVTIRLKSTALITMEGIVMFDQDPRIGRRLGERNPEAPFCSGFDSECSFGNCPLGFRLIWGPFCRGDFYPYIEPGLYRISLHGTGTVEAGATDFGATNQTFAFGSQLMTLPGTYEFCYPGLQSGGTGWETLVRAQDPAARVDRITVEYLGGDCTLPWTQPGSRRSIMTVANIEGEVEVSIPGITRVLQPGEWVRIILEDGQPIDLGLPFTGMAPFGSDVITWLAEDDGGLRWVNENRPPGGTDPRGEVTFEGTSFARTNLRASAGPLAGKIVFWSSRDYSYTSDTRTQQMVGEIYVMNEDGSGQTRLSSNWRRGNLFPPHPIVHPDGTEIVVRNFSDDSLEFYSPDFVLTETIPGWGWIEQVFDWSADGRKILLAMNDERNGGSTRGLYYYDLATRTFVLILEGNIYPASWSPDGQQIAYVEDGALWIFSLTDNSKRQILAEEVAEVVWSPVDAILAITMRSGGSNDLFTINVDGTGLRNLTNTPNIYEISPSWSPSGKQIAYARQGTDGNGWDDIFVIDLLTGRSQQLTTPGDNRYPYWTRTAVRLAPTPDALDVVITDLEDATGLLGQSPTDEATQIYRALSLWDEVHRRAIRELRTDELPTVLAEAALTRQTDAIATLRGGNCYWVVDVLSPPVITALDFVGSEDASARVLKNWDMDLVCNNARDEQTEQDGEYIATYILHRGAQGWRIVERDVEDVTPADRAVLARAATQPTTSAGNLPAPLYYIDSTTQQIFRLEPDGVTTTQITREADPVNFFDVSPVDGSLVYVTNNTMVQTDANGDNRMVKIVGERVGTERITDSYIDKQIVDPAFSPDGETIAFGLNGINVVPAGRSSEFELLLANEYDDQFEFQFLLVGYVGMEWSPTGDKLAVTVRYYEGGGNAIFDINSKRLITIRSQEEGVATDGDWAWLDDGQSLLVGGLICGYCGYPGLSLVDANFGAIRGLIKGERYPVQRASVGIVAPYSVSEDEVLLFAADYPAGYDLFDASPPSFRLAKYSQRARRIVPLRSRALEPTDVLWARDGTGAVIKNGRWDGTPGAYAKLPSLWITVAGGERTLPIEAESWRWGPADSAPAAAQGAERTAARTALSSAPGDLLEAIYGEMPGYRRDTNADGVPIALWSYPDAMFGGPYNGTAVATIALTEAYTEGGVEKLFVVTRLAPEGEFSCRLCYPGVGAAVLQKIDDEWEIAAVTPAMDNLFGMWGEIYQGTLTQIGDDAYGILFDTYFGGGPMGFNNSGHALMYPVDGAVAIVFNENTDEEPYAACEQEPDLCYGWTGELGFRDSGASDLYDIVLTREGTRLTADNSAIEEFQEEQIYRFDGRHYQPVAESPERPADAASTQSDEEAIRELVVQWDALYRSSIEALVTDGLGDVLSGQALDEQRETIQTLSAANCHWTIDVLATQPVTYLAIEADEAVAHVRKNWDRDLICNGQRSEMAEGDGEFLAIYGMKRLSDGWRIVYKDSVDVNGAFGETVRLLMAAAERNDTLLARSLLQSESAWAIPYGAEGAPVSADESAQNVTILADAMNRDMTCMGYRINEDVSPAIAELMVMDLNIPWREAFAWGEPYERTSIVWLTFSLKNGIWTLVGYNPRPFEFGGLMGTLTPCAEEE